MRQYDIDTNVILRLIVNDDAEQRRLAVQLSEQLGNAFVGHLTLITLIELDWALRSRYGYVRADVVAAVNALLRVRGLSIESHDLVVSALKLMRGKSDFADVLIALKCRDAGCEKTVTFDQTAARLIPGMELLA
ncbi:type II toxin-antitoxin system VapC family toxin [Rhizobium sp. NFR03]|uniref:PIN domain-containing protein n=1 Tax=Rhizobium sp. NFR03 TaxID=1566263 RepID=UPI0008B58568|nr:type II toxin-antitoxin system VapC family toxin [Rhizobium sp. NFR03]SES33604.1 Predicted nucleic-acid-binding protein, contains PIN domain [Rhizobium sp. NFR03]